MEIPDTLHTGVSPDLGSDMNCATSPEAARPSRIERLAHFITKSTDPLLRLHEPLDRFGNWIGRHIVKEDATPTDAHELHDAKKRAEQDEGTIIHINWR